jgi:hypothetical protein
MDTANGGSTNQKKQLLKSPQKDCDTTENTDCRDTFTASAYLGLAIDTFAAAETLKYLNPNAAGGTQERAIGGFDFAFRLLGPSRDAKAEGKEKPRTGPRAQQLWIYGETMHGTRSAELDCTKSPAKDLLACSGSLTTPGKPGDQLLYIIRNASSLEGYMGLRWEFLTLQPGSDSPANLYFKAQAGFLTVAGAPAVKDVHHLGIGATVTKNSFMDSHFEVGWGRTDLFQSKPRGRWKVDGYLQWRIASTPFSFFAQAIVDSDLGYGADSVQSYVGFNFSLDQLIAKKSDTSKPKQTNAKQSDAKQ